MKKLFAFLLAAALLLSSLPCAVSGSAGVRAASGGLELVYDAANSTAENRAVNICYRGMESLIAAQLDLSFPKDTVLKITAENEMEGAEYGYNLSAPASGFCRVIMYTLNGSVASADNLLVTLRFTVPRDAESFEISAVDPIMTDGNVSLDSGSMDISSVIIPKYGGSSETAPPAETSPPIPPRASDTPEPTPTAVSWDSSGVSGGFEWGISGDTLVLKGHGNMSDYGAGKAEWYAQRGTVKHIRFANDDVTSVGDNAFYGMNKVTDVELPAEIMSIGNRAFYGCSALGSIDLKNMSGAIGEDAFGSCTALTSVTVPETAAAAAKGAFGGCSALREITLPFVGSQNGANDNSDTFSYIFGGSVPPSLKSVTITNETALPDGAFAGLSGIENITVNAEVRSIGAAAFDGCSALKAFGVPDGVTVINDNTFRGCRAAEAIVIPDSVGEIGAAAFDGCASLNAVNIPSGVKNIYDYTFRNCSSLTKLEIPSTVVSIGENVLKGCGALYSLKIPFVGAHYDVDVTDITYTGVFGYLFGRADGGGVEQGGTRYAVPPSVTKVEITNSEKNSVIPPGAFMNCSNIKDIIIDGGHHVCADAFVNCVNLRSLYLPKDIARIETEVLLGCDNLELLTIPFVGTSRLDSGTETSVLGHFFGKSEKSEKVSDVEQFYNERGSNFYHIPRTLKKVVVLNQTDIPFGAFMGCFNIEEVSIITGVKINDKAFYNCTGLKRAVLPADMMEIGYEAFAECGELLSINLPSGAKKIGDHAFYNDRRLGDVVIPGSVDSIADTAFAGTNMSVSSDMSVMSGGLTIVCSEGSAAQKHAEKKGINYRLESEEALNIKQTATIVNQLKSDGSYIFSVTDTNVLGGRLLIAFYGGDGGMTELIALDDDRQPLYNVSVSRETVENAQTAKVFVWDSADRMKSRTTRAETLDLSIN